MRVLALLPTLTPPAHLTALAELGHDVHLVATTPGPVGGYMDGVRVWSTGYWWQATHGSNPHVLLTQTGDQGGERLTNRIRRTPKISLPADPGLTAAELADVLLAAIPAGRAREAARAATADVAALDAGRAVDVVAWMHYGIPHRRAGSEVMLHAMLRALQQSGMSVLAVTSEMPDAPAVWDVDGVEYRQLPHASADMFIRRVRPRVLVTHHHLAPGAISLAKTIGARSVLVQHNDHAAQARFVLARPNLVIYNTDWVRESLRERWLEVDQVPGSVVRPPVSLDEHRTEITGDAVTLVNLSQNKGVETWRATAGLLPDLPFLGVTGAHGPQETRLVPPNARVIPQTSDMRADVWARTRVLLMPSVYESYGMVAVEALASSIPVVAHPTPGLVEALGDAATFIDRDDHQAWAEAIRSLYRGGRRRGAAQKAAWDRSAFLEERTRSELQHWVSTVLELVSRR